MAGMYPDDRIVEIFGEQVKYPGLDPDTNKFTDGDFFDPLKKPSYIPAETFNLILDNLSELLVSLGKIPNNQSTNQLAEAVDDMLKANLKANIDIIYPLGSGYTQHLNDPDPVEKGLPGQWAVWTGRAEAYRLTASALPAFTTYTPGKNYAANAYVLWHLSGAGYELWKAKAAITGAAAQLDPILWDKYTTGSIVERRLVQGWLADDMAVGDVVGGGNYAGQMVSEVIALGGTFPSWEGGNRPTFISGGVAGDRIRNITGSVSTQYAHVTDWVGAFYYNYANTSPATAGATNVPVGIGFNTSLVVPTGADNSPRTLSSRFWRRVA